MKIKDLIEKLSEFDEDMEVAIADFQFNCCDPHIMISENYMDYSNELYSKEDFEEGWEHIVEENELERIILLS